MSINQKEFEVRKRASYQCEYCHTSLAGMIYEVDHIVPVVLGGDDSSSNLAMACSRCNRNKSDWVAYIDPHTKNVSRLFNPRIDEWSEHIHHFGGETVGRTEMGRATLALLLKATKRFSPPDLKWDKLEGLERSENIYRFLNDLRFQRLHNAFQPLQTGLRIQSEEDLSATEREVETTARQLLELEMMFTRSKPSDVAKGIQLGEGLLGKVSGKTLQEIQLILSILYQQRATINLSKGQHNAARKDQQRACSLFDSRKNTVLDPEEDKTLWDTLRQMVLATKYETVSFSDVLLDDLLRACIDLDNEADFRHLIYLSDLALRDSNSSFRILESLYALFTRLLEEGGYGQAYDRAKFITLRRRWWLLHLLLEPDPWLEAMQADIAYWQGLQMFNEAREFRSGLFLQRYKISSPSFERALEVIDLATKTNLDQSGTHPDSSVVD